MSGNYTHPDIKRLPMDDLYRQVASMERFLLNPFIQTSPNHVAFYERRKDALYQEIYKRKYNEVVKELKNRGPKN